MINALRMSNFGQVLQSFRLEGLAVPGFILLIIAMLVIPMPAFLLDVMFTLNIVLGLVIIMISINVSKPLEFSSFPSLLLMATMLRLSLNVASTRIVLVKGHEGSDAAGQVIESFGDFVISGNYVVGFIIFSILMIINFIVVTKGAGRVSEVIARFTLDAMPGKQMAIDADLNAGIINQETAKSRREEISQESDFFGSMDGASKFVRGDAIAGIIILAINIIGGLLIGMLQHDLSFADAGRIYVLLTIGDGLVAQIPALLLSLSTAIIVTRVTTSESMATQTTGQLSDPTAFWIASAILFLLGIIPGMPHFIFLLFSALSAATGYRITTQRREKVDADRVEEAKKQEESNPDELLGWDDIEQSDLVSLEIGYGLIPLISNDSGGNLLIRIRGVRKKLSAELGFLLQPIRVRDNLDLKPDTYNILLRGIVRARGEIRVGYELAINPGNVEIPLDGIKTKEPTYGLDAWWILPSQRDYARMLGYTVVDYSTAIATHLITVLKDNSAELLGHEESQKLLDKISEKSPKLVQDLLPEKLTLSSLTQVLRNLVSEGIPLRDMRTILEGLIAETTKSKDPDELTNLIRPWLGRTIMQNLIEPDKPLTVMTLDPPLENMLQNTLAQSRKVGELVMDPKMAESLFKAIAEKQHVAEESGLPPVLVVSPGIRAWLAKSLKPRAPGVVVLAYTEIPEDQDITVLAKISISEPQIEENNEV
jgi:flagellar biosynthesis protein FlhA